jgi:hypothetical protein
VHSRFDANLSKLKELLAAKTPHDDPKVAALRAGLKADFVPALQAGAEDIDEPVWKLCFHRRIDDYRKRISALGPGAAQTRLVGEYRQFLNEARDFFDRAFAQMAPGRSARILHRLALCMGDVLRYREMVSDVGQKRYAEAEKWYLRACRLDPAAGAPHNQLAVLASLNQLDLVVVYRYERALAIARPFQMAKINLKAALEQALAANGAAGPPLQFAQAQPMSSADRAALRSDFSSRLVRLHASLLLPPTSSSGLAAAGAAGAMPDLESALAQVMHTSAFREGSEALVAVASMAVFAVTNADALGRGSEPHPAAGEVLDATTRALAAHALAVADDLPRLARALVPLTVCCDGAPLHCLWTSTRQVLARLAQALQGLDPAQVARVRVPDQDEDLAAFAPLQRLAPQVNVDKALSDQPADTGLAVRISRVLALVRQFQIAEDAEFARFALGGEVERAEAEDEDVILFRPSFSRADSAPDLLLPVAATSSAWGGGTSSGGAGGALFFPPVLQQPAGKPSGDWLSQVSWGLLQPAAGGGGLGGADPSPPGFGAAATTATGPAAGNGWNRPVAAQSRTPPPGFF